MVIDKGVYLGTTNAIFRPFFNMVGLIMGWGLVLSMRGDSMVAKYSASTGKHTRMDRRSLVLLCCMSEYASSWGLNL